MKEQETKHDETAETVRDLEITSEQAEEVQGGTTLPTIRPYEPSFRGGVKVAVGDLN